MPSSTGRLKARLLPEAVPLVITRLELAAALERSRWWE
jgi:hypothetical protein